MIHKPAYGRRRPDDGGHPRRRPGNRCSRRTGPSREPRPRTPSSCTCETYSRRPRAAHGRVLGPTDRPAGHALPRDPAREPHPADRPVHGEGRRGGDRADDDPTARFSDLGVYVPNWQRAAVKTRPQFHRTEHTLSIRVFPEQIAQAPSRYVLLSSGSNVSQLISPRGLGPDRLVVWSLWSGYLRMSPPVTRSWRQDHPWLRCQERSVSRRAHRDCSPHPPRPEFTCVLVVMGQAVEAAERGQHDSPRV